jgi:hypothetical protein
VSSRAVRTTFRGWAATLATPFYDTINLSVSPSDAIWSTASFDSFSNQVMTFCRDMEEVGQIELMYMAQPGVGDDAVLQAAEADIAALMAKTDATGKFVLTEYDPPSDISFGEDSKYRVSVVFLYVFYH